MIQRLISTQICLNQCIALFDDDASCQKFHPDGLSSAHQRKKCCKWSHISFKWMYPLGKLSGINHNDMLSDPLISNKITVLD